MSFIVWLYLQGFRKFLCACDCDQLLATPWTVAHQSPLSMGLSQQDTGVVYHFLLQMILLFPAASALAGEFFTTVPAGKPIYISNQSRLNISWIYWIEWIYWRLNISSRVNPSNIASLKISGGYNYLHSYFKYIFKVSSSRKRRLTLLLGSC